MSSSRFRAPQLLLIASLWLPSHAGAEPPATATLTRGPIVRELVESGEVRAIASREIQAPLEWRMDLQIVWLHPEGVVVAPGDTLVRLDTATIEQALDEALNLRAEREADLLRIDAEQAQRRLELENQVQQARYRAAQAELRLEKLGFESESVRQDARLELEKARIAETEAAAKLRAQATLDSLATAQAKLQIAEAADRVAAERSQIASMTLTAPITGLVVHADDRGAGRKLRAGDVVDGGQGIVRLPDLSRMEAIVELNEVDRERVFVGQRARVSLDAYPELDLPGELTTLARLALPAREESAVRVFRAQVRIDGRDDRVKPGMTAKVRLALDRRDDAVRIPRGAMFTTPSGETVVFPRAAWPRARGVRTGLVSPRWVEALEGAEPGEALALEAPPGASAGPWRGGEVPE